MLPTAAVPSGARFSWHSGPPHPSWRRLAEECGARDGGRNCNDQLWAAAERCCREEGGRALLLLGKGEAELHVHPDARGQGWGSWLLGEAGPCRVWAYGARSRSLGWLQRLGFTQQRTLLSLERPPLQAAPPEWPPGVELKLCSEGDPERWHELHCRLQAHPANAWSRGQLEWQLRQPETPPSGLGLLWQGKQLLGYLWLKRWPDRSEVFMYALAPEARGRGLGHRLLAWGLAQAPGPVSAYCDLSRPAALRTLLVAGFEERSRDACLAN